MLSDSRLYGTSRDVPKPGDFAHLKKGRIYRFSYKSVGSGALERLALYLYKVPVPYPENRIGVITGGPMVVYFETILTERGCFHKLLVNDQIGYVLCSPNIYRLKRITLRMLRRMETASENEGDSEDS